MRPDGSIVEKDPAPELQTVCRRNPPGARQVHVDVPVMRDGQPIMDGKGKPRTERMLGFQYGYQPTAPELVCFDGWRPAGTKPGEAPRIRREFATVL
jgi:hypothetical protein